MVEVVGFKGTKKEGKTVTAVDTQTTEKDGLMQSKDKVFVAQCEFATITVPTACLAMSITSCKSCVIVVDRVMTVVEMVGCKDVTIRFNTQCRNVDISKSSDILLDYTTAQERGPIKGINVVTEAWSQVTIGFKKGDKMVEKSLPTKIDHKFDVNEDNGELDLVTTPSPLA